MLAKLRSSLTYANVMATVAVFVALGGTSYAVATGSIDSRKLKNNSVRSKDIRNNDVRGRDIRNGTIGSRDVNDGALLANDFKADQLPAGPRGATGPQGPKGDDGAPGAPGISGYQALQVTTAFDSTSAKSNNLECPAGSSIIGGGSQVIGTVAGVALQQDGQGDLATSNTWTALVSEIVAQNQNWAVRTTVYCANVAP